MKEYKGIKYESAPGGAWRLTFPSGLKTTAPAQTEDELKAGIDQHEAAVQDDQG